MPTRVGVITAPSSTKTDSGITRCAVGLVVSKDGDPRFGKAHRAFNPFLLQLVCKDVREPISVFYVLHGIFPSAISAYSELTCFLMTRNLIC